jgi:hypothetical protein
VFVQGTFRKATEVPECFDSEINRLNEATEKLAIVIFVYINARKTLKLVALQIFSRGAR